MTDDLIIAGFFLMGAVLIVSFITRLKDDFMQHWFDDEDSNNG
jgi:hypothetical protein